MEKENEEEDEKVLIKRKEIKKTKEGNVEERE